MNEIFKHLENKYGKWISTPNYFYNHHMPEYGGQAYLNIVYTKNNYKSIIKVLKNQKIVLNKSLDDFYKHYNGLSLLAHSIKLYGYQPERVNDQAPLDFERTNGMKRTQYPSFNPSYFIIGSYSHYYFCLKQRDNSKQIYVINFNNMVIVKTFAIIEDLISYCLLKVEPLYSSNGVYLGRKNENKGWANNIALDDIFWL